MRLYTLTTLLLVLALTGCGAVADPVISRVHTLSIHVRDFETFNAALRLVRDDLELPLKWGEEWSPEFDGKRKYAGVWAGNMCIEPCGPYETDEFPGDAMAMFFAITFLPYESSEASATVLDGRGIQNSGPKVYLTVPDPLLSSGNAGVCIMDHGVEDRAKDLARHEELQAELDARSGGSLGIVGVEEILVRCPSEEHFEQWRNFLRPLKPSEHRAWRIGSGPVIRLVESDTMGIQGIVIRVRSLEQARESLKAKGLLGAESEGRVQVDPGKTVGLTIFLEGDALRSRSLE